MKKKYMHNLLLFIAIFLFICTIIYRVKENFEENKDNKLTLITHVYNEEYLLPFWLTHHRGIFDDLIVIDYKSTDRSIEICKELWPNCTIITSRNEKFEAIEVDKEVMDVENSVAGIKMVLNTTEFLVKDTNIKEMFYEKKSYGVVPYGPYSLTEKNINTTDELFKSLLDDDVKFYEESEVRGQRQIHNYNNGNYTTGRHSTNNPSEISDKLYIIWLGFYPLNESLFKRKLQIKEKMSESDKTNGYGIQHFMQKNELMDTLTDKYNKGDSLENINLELYNIIKNY